MMIQKNNKKWFETSNFKNGMWVFKNNFKDICGENVYGKGKGCEEIATKNIITYLERSMNILNFTTILPAEIVKPNITRKIILNRLIKLCEKAPLYFKKFKKTKVTDNWALKIKSIVNGMPLNKNIRSHKRLLEYGGKRFSGKNLTIKENVIEMIETSRDILAEGYIISFLNSGLMCPECKSIGNIGWYEGMEIECTDSFRDGICMNCFKNNKITLFEIKTKWENCVKNKNNIYSGSFISLNVLLAMNAKVYLIVASRDTGHIRIGKITHSKMRGNKRWLYALQENYNWGSPSSISYCEDGLKLLPVKMEPLNNILTDKFCQDIFKEVIDNCIKCKHCENRDIKYYRSNFSKNMIPLCKKCANFECCLMCGWECGENVCSACTSSI